LHDEDVGAADRLAVAAVRLVVGESLERDLSELDAEVTADVLGERPVRAPENSMSRFIGPSSMIFSGLGKAPVAGSSSPGS